jgi:DNA-binding Lrp family transcriptional regulator
MENAAEKILKLISSSKEGILQSELWKAADIDSRKCSKIVAKLREQGLITREPEVSNGIRTFRIKYAGLDKQRYRYLLAGGMFSPCTRSVCGIECTPENCTFLTEWINRLVEEGRESGQND